MTMNLLSRATANVSIPNGLHNFAIAQIILFSIIYLAQLPMRYKQEWKYWHHKKRQHPSRCALYSGWSMVGLLAMIRIAGSAMVLSNSHPNESMLTAEISLQSVGLSPLMFEVSLVLLRCGQVGEFGPGQSKHPKPLRFALHAFRFPVFVAIVLGVVGRIIELKPLGEAGSVVLVVTFAFVTGLIAWLAVKSHSTLPVEGHRGVLLVSLALPFLWVRVIYFLLQQYGPARFSLASGDVGVLVGMGLIMEIITVSLLLTARAVIEPILSTDSKRCVVADDFEQA
ncbi:hypothetical protein N7494_010996 [Penicillium frequentans]|uniref:DUF7702 domain-containing protein n=1 Tax=Penicillium frequentans TaxID=3151616 RepID=A0AAD6G8S3_9EURO|nr:hypothetical protein N7494_010996 [Penicillium glabrum]